MADFFLHCKLIETLYKKNPSYKYLDYAKIGTQGPDPFFNILKKSYKEGNRLGNKLHHEKINESLISMTNYVKDNYSEVLMAYLKGYLAHFALDIHIHPYIFYWTGEYDKQRPETYHYFGYHMRFERSVDVAYIYDKYKKNASAFHKYQRVFPSPVIPDEIKDLMTHVVKQTFDVDQGGMYLENGYHMMRKLSKTLIKDRLGLKKLFLRFVGLFLKMSMLKIYDYPYTNKPLKYDYLNLKHNTWHHPVTNKAYTLSVYDIFDEALVELEYLIEQVELYIKGDTSIDLEKLFNNRSYDTGLNILTQGPMKHFKLYTKK